MYETGLFDLSVGKDTLSRPDILDIRPDIVDIRPDILDIRPEILDIRPDILDIRPDILDIRPEILDIRPDILDIRPDLFWHIALALSPVVLFVFTEKHIFTFFTEVHLAEWESCIIAMETNYRVPVAPTTSYGIQIILRHTAYSLVHLSTLLLMKTTQSHAF